MNDKNEKLFGLKDKLGYMFGDFGNDFTFILSSIILMKFYSDVMGINIGLIGFMMMLARFVDAFTDVAMGRICDRSRITPVGKFKPWIRRMCVPVAITSFLLYQSSLADESLTFKVIYLFVILILQSISLYLKVVKKY